MRRCIWQRHLICSRTFFLLSFFTFWKCFSIYLRRQLEFCFLWNISTHFFFFLVGGGLLLLVGDVMLPRLSLTGNLASVILTTWSFWHNCTWRQLSWHRARCAFLIAEAQYWSFPPVSAGIWQYNHRPIYSLCRVMRCTALGPHRAELRLNSTANVPQRPECLYTPDAYLGLRNWNPWGCSIPFSQRSRWESQPLLGELSLDKPAEDTDCQHHAHLAVVRFCPGCFSSHPAALQEQRRGSHVEDTGGLLNWEQLLLLITTTLSVSTLHFVIWNRPHPAPFLIILDCPWI